MSAAVGGVQLVRLLEVRALPYSLDISEATFTAEDYVELLLLMLRSRFAARVAFRACHAAASPWLRQRAFVFLRLCLPGGCVDDGLLPHASAQTDPKEEADLGRRLIEEWLRPCHVRTPPPLRHLHAHPPPVLLASSASFWPTPRPHLAFRGDSQLGLMVPPAFGASQA